MEIVQKNWKEELCHYFSGQELSENTEQGWVINPFLKAAIDEANLGTKT